MNNINLTPILYISLVVLCFLQGNRRGLGDSSCILWWTQWIGHHSRHEQFRDCKNPCDHVLKVLLPAVCFFRSPTAAHFGSYTGWGHLMPSMCINLGHHYLRIVPIPEKKRY